MTTELAVVEVLNLESMNELLNRDLDNGAIDFQDLSTYLDQHRADPEFQNLLQQFREPALTRVRERLPDIERRLFLDMSTVRRSQGYNNIVQLLDSYVPVENTPLSTRIRNAANTSITAIRNNPGKSLAVLFVLFLIISGGIVVAILRNKFTASNNNDDNQTLPPPQNQTSTPEPEPTPPYQGSPIPQSLTGTWVYPAVIDPSTGSVVGNEPEPLLDDILDFNTNTSRKITAVYTYGGSMEIYSPVTTDNVHFYYEDGGSNTTSLFCNAANSSGFQVAPIVDGNVASIELSALNQLSTQEASVVANLVASKLFSYDNCSTGAAFDLEPFELTEGQVNFYKSVARTFSGTEFNCRNPLFPNGRFFSVFVSASQVNGDLANILNQYRNGYVIAPLYDLGSTQPTSLAEYQSLVDSEIKVMMAASSAYNVRYQLGIPAAGTAHEFESRNGVPSNISQTDYVKIALTSIDRNGATNDANFMGISVWTFSHSILFRNTGGITTVTPTMPEPETLEYLSNRSTVER